MFVLIIGPMFSGKTTELITQINKYKYSNINNIKKNMCFVKNIDDRYGITNKLVSHPKNINMDAIVITSLDDIKLKNYDIIGIDEGHFYDSNKLINIIKKIFKLKKILILTMLNGDYKQQPFINFGKICALASKIKYKKSSCRICNKPASFTTTNKNFENKNIIKSDDGKIFFPVCYEHI